MLGTLQIITIKQYFINFDFSTNNNPNLLTTNNNKPMLRRKSVAVIPSLPSTSTPQSFCGDSLGMPKDTINLARQR